jgi:predicted nucleic acid-binding Zn ribbon protein
MENQRPAMKILQHRHCQVCGKAIKAKEEMCSDRCKKDWESTVKRKRFQLMAFLLFGSVLVIISIYAWR